MKRVSLLTAILILFGFMSATAAITFGGHLGVKIEDVKDPGASISIGTQESLGEKDVLRFTYQSVNFGNEDLNNIAAMEIHYFGIAERWDLGTRIAADYQPDDGNIGIAIGLEFIRKDFAKNLSAFVCVDAVKKEDIGTYINFGIGLIASFGK